jgi:hypothetical protein
MSVVANPKKMIWMELLPPGTVNDMFRKRNIPVRMREPIDPLSLPSVPTQCAHVFTEYNPDSPVTHMRCVDDADPTLRHGWLCRDHATDLDVWFRPRLTLTPTLKSRETVDVEVVESILALERKVIASGTRVVVRIGAQTRITFLT